MAIKYNFCDGEVIIEQTLSRPLIYLDNWAIQIFYKDINMQERLLKILNNKKATVAISTINLYEIVNRTDKKQKLDIISFIEKFDDVLMENNPVKVIKRENLFYSMNENKHLVMPWEQVELLKLLGMYGSPLKPLKVSEILYNLNNEIQDLNYKLNEYFEKELFPLVLKCRSNEERLLEAKSKVKRKIEKNKSDVPYTRQLYEFVFEYIASIETMKMGEAEWRDVFHVIVPVAYCDFVLIDKRWVEFVKSTGLEYPDIAKVYSQKDLETFLNDVEKYNK